MLFCEKCGTKLSEDSVFCKKCGRKVVRFDSKENTKKTRNWVSEPPESPELKPAPVYNWPATTELSAQGKSSAVVAEYIAEQRAKKIKKFLFTVGLVIVFFVITVIIIGSCDSNNGSDSNNSSVKSTESMAEFKASCQIYSYDVIARNPSAYNGKRAVLQGVVNQVVENGNNIILRVGITTSSDSLNTERFDNVMIVEYARKSSGERRILKDDTITMYGTLKGTTTYETVLHQQITAPAFQAEYIEDNTASSVQSDQSSTDEEKSFSDSSASYSEVSESISEFKASCMEYSYDLIERNTYDYVGKRAVFTGTVDYISENGDEVEFNLNLSLSSWYSNSKMIRVTYTKKSSTEDRILKGDKVTVYGTLNGIANIWNYPLLEAEYIEINN